MDVSTAPTFVLLHLCTRGPVARRHTVAPTRNRVSQGSLRLGGVSVYECLVLEAVACAFFLSFFLPVTYRCDFLAW